MAATVCPKLNNVKIGERGRTLWGSDNLGPIPEGMLASTLPRVSSSLLCKRCWGCSWGYRELKMTLSCGQMELQRLGGGAIAEPRLQRRPTIEASTSPASPRGVVLTGASKGLGFAMAQEFLKQGNSIVICSRSQEEVDKAVAALKTLERTAGGRIYGAKCDVGTAQDVENLSVFAREKLGTVHIWLNNAGQVTSKRLLADVPIDEIQSAVSCNVLGSLLGSRAAVRLMREQPGAEEGPPPFHILNFGFTEFGAKNTKSATTHKATKSSLMWLTRSLLDELKEAGEGS